MRRKFILDGKMFHDLEGFYCEIDRLFTKNLSWKTGHNLDAVNDILRGGFGVHDYAEPITISWINFNKSRRDFGYETTEEYYRHILLACHPSNRKAITKQLDDAMRRKGETILDIIVETIANNDPGHKDTELEIIE